MINITLVKPSAQYKKSFLDGFEELTTVSDRRSWVYLGDEANLNIPKSDFDAYVNSLLLRETVPPPHFVCDTIYWAVSSSEIVGRIAIRHELNDFLRKFGGHIGYIVRPTWRNRGVAKEMLRQILLTEEAQKIGKLLLICDDHNLASEKTILINGGVHIETLAPADGKPQKKHFWIDLSRPQPTETI